MTQTIVEEKLKRAAGVICKQGMVQFPLSDTAIDIVFSVVGDLRGVRMDGSIIVVAVLRIDVTVAIQIVLRGGRVTVIVLAVAGLGGRGAGGPLAGGAALAGAGRPTARGAGAGGAGLAFPPAAALREHHPAVAEDVVGIGGPGGQRVGEQQLAGGDRALRRGVDVERNGARHVRCRR